MGGGLAAFAAWLDAIGFGGWARAAPHVYPVANVVHLLGLVMLVGGIGVVDLRLAGLWRALPAAAVARALTPVAIGGLAVLAASGLVLFAADGKALAASDTFRLKLVLIALALANALAFRLAWQRRGREDEAQARLLPRLMAAGSLLLWLAVGTAGRMIAYS